MRHGDVRLTAVRDSFSRKEKDYTAKLKEEGCSLILKYAVACFRKKCRIVCEREEYPSEE